MFNKQILIFLSIFSFSLQDNNCFIYFERCEGEDKEDKPYQGKIDNCIAGTTDGDGNEMCYQCKNGYYVSMERTSCIKVEKQIEKCLSYSSNGDELFCSYCDKGYITSADQKTCKESKNCEYLTTNAKEEEICGECDTGYALTYDEKSCKQFENCEKLVKEMKNVVNVMNIFIQIQKENVKELYAKNMITMFVPNAMMDITLMMIRNAKKLQLKIA